MSDCCLHEVFLCMHASFHACMHAPSSCMKFHALRACMYLLHACMHPLHACMKHACKSANLHACIMHAVHACLMHDSCMHCMHDACMQCMHAQFRRVYDFVMCLQGCPSQPTAGSIKWLLGSFVPAAFMIFQIILFLYRGRYGSTVALG